MCARIGVYVCELELSSLSLHTPTYPEFCSIFYDTFKLQLVLTALPTLMIVQSFLVAFKAFFIILNFLFSIIINNHHYYYDYYYYY